ncbi:hypothetical protein [Amycolatopsis kentuckyensis]|uniref:hypothetical protein n=1 Tax=Amycolatopsis kentuckyensis TaxID=218823 RepID=UPI0035658081
MVGDPLAGPFGGQLFERREVLAAFPVDHVPVRCEHLHHVGGAHGRLVDEDGPGVRPVRKAFGPVGDRSDVVGAGAPRELDGPSGRHPDRAVAPVAVLPLRFGDPFLDDDGGVDRLGRAVDGEGRDDPVVQVLADGAALALDRFADLVEEPGDRRQPADVSGPGLQGHRVRQGHVHDDLLRPHRVRELLTQGFHFPHHLFR